MFFNYVNFSLLKVHNGSSETIAYEFLASSYNTCDQSPVKSSSLSLRTSQLEITVITHLIRGTLFL